MRTNIVLDDELVKTAFRYARVKTKKELIAVALKEYVETHSRMDLRDLKGTVRLARNYDHKNARKDRLR